jgi:hypothetical protein
MNLVSINGILVLQRPKIDLLFHGCNFFRI